MDSHGQEAFMFASEFPSLTPPSTQAWPLSGINPVNPTAPDTNNFFPSSIYGGGGSGGAKEDFPGLGGLHMPCSRSIPSSRFGSLHAELISKMNAQEIMDAKALAASKSHSEAERRRRERINAHMAKLRTLLPSATKTDKASLLAEVIQHVKELKRQTSSIAAAAAAAEEDYSPLPTETNELTLDAASGVDDDGRFTVKLSLCCDDRSDLIPDLARALKSLRLRTLKAEFATLGGRVRNILVVTGEDGDAAELQHHQSFLSSIQDALREVMERTATIGDASRSGGAAGGLKRQRTNDFCRH